MESARVWCRSYTQWIACLLGLCISGLWPIWSESSINWYSTLWFTPQIWYSVIQYGFRVNTIWLIGIQCGKAKEWSCHSFRLIIYYLINVTLQMLVETNLLANSSSNSYISVTTSVQRHSKLSQSLFCVLDRIKNVSVIMI